MLSGGGTMAAVRRIRESRRWRRRIFWSAVLLIGAVAAFIGVKLSSSGNPFNANGPVAPNYVPPKHAAFTPAEQQAVRPVLAEFERDAVARANPEQAWDVAGPSLREGFTRKQWSTGNLPVVPYPAADRGLGTWSYVKYSYRNRVGLEVFMFPKPGSGYSAMTAQAEVYKDQSGRWFVDYWLPERFHGPPSTQTKATAAMKAKARARARASSKSTQRSAAPNTGPQPPKVSGAWWAVPIGLLSLIILAPLTFMLVMWIRNRREQRRVLRS